MKYYLLKQPMNISNVAQPIPHDKLLGEIDEAEIILLDTKGSDKSDLVYLPYYDRPVWIISQEMQRIFSAYQTGAHFGYASFGYVYPEPYFIYKPFECKCLHEETEFWSERGPLKKLVLDREKIGYHKVFQIAGILENYLIADMEIVGKLLCAGVYPFEYEEVECR